jgi:thiol-disulfide isomerase/thioredoxin
MKHYLRFEVWIRRAPSVAVITGVVVVLTGWGTGLLTRFSVVKTANAASQPFVSDEGRLPDLDGAAWLNSPPLSRQSLRGKVVLVNFWTYTCINSLRPLPYVKTWAAKYKDAGLVVIGVHTPEFSFEHEPMNVENAVRTLHITFPVAIDSKTRIWQSFNNQAWPAQYLVDARGRIRYHHFGEGDYGEIERVIQELLKENGAAGLVSGTTSVSGVGIEAAPDWTEERSPETYIGYRQAQDFASPEKMHENSIQVFSAPPETFFEPLGIGRVMERQCRKRRAAGSARQDPVPVPQPRPEPGAGSCERRQARSVCREIGWRRPRGRLWR